MLISDSPEIQCQSDEFRLKHALYFYEDDYRSVCIKHTANSKTQKLGLGVPVDANTLFSTLVESGQNKIEQLLPERLLLDTTQFSIWYSLRQKRQMFFRLNNKRASFKVTYPALVWGVNKHRRRLSVAAIGNKRPNLESKIYHAPLMNIGSEFSVCQGTAVIPDLIGINSSIMETVESCIFDSSFSHVNHSKTLKGKKETSTQDQFRYWQNKAKNKSVPRLSELNECGNLQDFIEKVKS